MKKITDFTVGIRDHTSQPVYMRPVTHSNWKLTKIDKNCNFFKISSINLKEIGQNTVGIVGHDRRFVWAHLTRESRIKKLTSARNTSLRQLRFARSAHTLNVVQGAQGRITHKYVIPRGIHVRAF